MEILKKRFSKKEDIIYFPNLPRIEIEGLEYFPNYISKEEEEELFKKIDNNDWIKAVRRRQQHYGYVYYHTRNNIPLVQPSKQEKQPHLLPLSTFDFLISRMIKDEIFPIHDPPTQCLVNEYIEDVRIASHLDNFNAFGDTIAGLSLGSCCYMTMRYHENPKIETKFLMESGSLYVMKKDARYKWQHGITKMKHFINPKTEQIIHRDNTFRRISLTFRKILVQGTKNGENPLHEEELTWIKK